LESKFLSFSELLIVHKSTPEKKKSLVIKEYWHLVCLPTTHTVLPNLLGKSQASVQLMIFVSIPSEKLFLKTTALPIPLL
jgi:hypothetical protein